VVGVQGPLFGGLLREEEKEEKKKKFREDSRGKVVVLETHVDVGGGRERLTKRRRE